MKSSKINRRNFLKKATLPVVASVAISSPSLLKAQTSVELSLVTSWPSNFPGIGLGANRLANRIQNLSNNEIKVNVYSAGELVPPFGVFDATSSGTADMYHSADFYWSGKSKAYPFFASVPFGMTASEFNSWIYANEGQDLWNELGSKFNMKHFLVGNTGTTLFGWFKNEFNDLNDFSKIKIRSPGFGGDLLKTLGATPINLAGGDILPSLASGAIDAADWSNPVMDLAFGFYKVAKFCYYPDFKKPTVSISLGFNLDKWNELSSQHQSIIQNACQAENQEMLADFVNKESLAIDKLKSLGVIFKKVPDEIIIEASKNVESVIDSYAVDETSTKVRDSYFKFLNKRKSFSDFDISNYLNSRKA
ncbi:TRAP transporter substrate-binding protein [Alphaproteobacteria bacterium]|nr:TRAP transporter substrate-binding protein [Alphaproteobacteria bacterium]